MDALEERVRLELHKCLLSREFDALHKHARQAICLRLDEKLHAARPCEEVLLTTLLHLTDLVLLSER